MLKSYDGHPKNLVESNNDIKENLRNLLNDPYHEDLNLQEEKESIEKYFKVLILKNLIYIHLEEYRKFVNDLSKNMQLLPNYFENIIQYQTKFREYIEIAVHLDIQAGWSSIDIKKSNILKISKIVITPNHKDEADQVEFEVGIEFDEKSFETSIQSHLHQAIILLKMNKTPELEILGISQFSCAPKSKILYINFRCKKSDENYIRELISNRNNCWQAIYVTSLIDWTRNYTSSFMLSNKEFLRKIVTGDINLSPLPKNSKPINTENFALNAEQNRMVQQVLRGNDKVNILYGPPGTGKTKTLASIIYIATETLNWRTLVTAPSNQALGELATRLIRTNIKMVVEGDKDKLPKDLEILLLNGWSKRLRNSLITITNLADQILYYFSTKNTIERPDYSLLSSELSELIIQLNNFIKQLGLSELLLEKLNYLEKNNYTKYNLTRYLQEFRNLNNPETDLLSLRDWLNQIKIDIYTLKTQALNFKSLKKIEEHLLTQRGIVIFATPARIANLNLRNIDLTVFDEAAHKIEACCLNVFASDTERLILAGDPKQLSPLTFHVKAIECKYNRSPLTRLIMDLNVPNIFLKTQYRMPKILSDFISEQFYNGKLETATDIKGSEQKIHINKREVQLAFIDIPAPSEKVGTGYKNTEEAYLIARLVLLIKQLNPEASIGVIAFYIKQAELLNQLLSNEKYVLISSVDKFQGGESDFIFISGTRSQGTGFLNDAARINVALSRARSGVLFFGNATNLSDVISIKNFINFAKKHSYYYNKNEFNRWLATEEQKLTTHESKTSQHLEYKANSIKYIDNHWAENMLALMKQYYDNTKSSNKLYISNTQLIEDINELKNQNDLLKQKIAPLEEEKNRLYSIVESLKTDANKVLEKQILNRKAEKQLFIQEQYQNQIEVKEMNDFNDLYDKIIDNYKLNSISQDLFYIKHKIYLKRYMLQKNAFNFLKDFFKDIDKDTYFDFLNQAMYSSDPILRCALFCRLSYIAYSQNDLWEALFFALQVNTFIAEPDNILAINHYKSYQDLVKKVIEESRLFLFKNDKIINIWSVPFDKIDKLFKFDLSKNGEESEKDTHINIVLNFMKLENGNFRIKVAALNSLIQNYKDLNYSYGFEFIKYQIDKLEKERVYRSKIEVEEITYKGRDDEYTLIEQLKQNYQHIIKVINKLNSSKEELEVSEITISKIAKIDLANLNNQSLKLSYYISIKDLLTNHSKYDNNYLFVIYEIIQILINQKKYQLILNILQEIQRIQKNEDNQFNEFFISWIIYNISKNLSSQIDTSILSCNPKLIFEIAYMDQGDFMQSPKIQKASSSEKLNDDSNMKDEPQYHEQNMYSPMLFKNSSIKNNFKITDPKINNHSNSRL